MYRSDLVPHSPLSQYLTYPSEAPSSEKSGIDRITNTFNSLKSSLTTIKNRIDSAMGSIERSMTRNSLFGRENILVKSENRGKFSDADNYRKCARFPIELNKSGQELLHPYGVEYGYSERLSPKMADRGKCFGGVNAFIAEYLERGIDTTKQKFKGGIPFEGVLNQEIYTKFSWSYSEPDDPGLPLNREQGIAHLNGMEIDWSSQNKTAQEIIETIGTLEPGAYNLSFPCTNPLGNEVGSHTTSLIIEEGGQSYFYDPNYAVARTSDPTKTVGRVFKHYTGYGSSRFEQIKNIFLLKPNHPSTPLADFSLSHYRKVEQL